MRRRRSSKTNSGSGPGISRIHPSSSHPIDIPAPKSAESWSTPESTFPPFASRSLPVHHQLRPAYRPSLGDFQDLSPSEYLSRSPDEYPTPALSLTSSPTVTRGEFQPQDLSRLSVSTAPGSAWEPGLLSRSVSDAGMTSGSTATSEPMSRVTTNEMLVGPLEACRFSSHASGCDSEMPSSRNDCSSFDLDGFFPGSLSFDSTDIFLPSLSQSQSFPPSHVPSSVDLLHSPSQESNASSSSSDSSQSRHLRRVQEQNAQSRRPLAPKTQSLELGPAIPPANVVEIVSEDGTLRRKAQIPRSNRQPKETNKIFCLLCNDHKEGFHGDHELRRHISRCHSTVRKVWVCKDISPDRTFLANCKHCRNGKAYGANYNAAAHLRRVHFNPCETPKGGRGKVSQNRGGIGGGDNPPMEYLRQWMTEMVESNDSGLTFEDSPTKSTSYALQYQSSPTDLGIDQSNGAIQISDADFDFVQQNAPLDMSFLRDCTNDPFVMPPQASPLSDSTVITSHNDVMFFDSDLTN